MTALAPTSPSVSFGPFHFFPAQQLLLEGDTRVRLGSQPNTDRTFRVR